LAWSGNSPQIRSEKQKKYIKNLRGRGKKKEHCLFFLVLVSFRLDGMFICVLLFFWFFLLFFSPLKHAASGVFQTQEELMISALGLATTIAEKSPAAVYGTKVGRQPPFQFKHNFKYNIPC
jgi:hypothetical protein